MHNLNDDVLFGHDMRHRPAPTIMLPAKVGYELIYERKNKRCYCGRRTKRIKELQPFAEMFDAPAVIGGDYLEMAGGWRFLLPTFSLGRIEIEIFRENYLLLPLDDAARHKIYAILNKAGYYYQIIGNQEFINIKRNLKDYDKS